MIAGGLDVGRVCDRTALVVLDTGVVTEAHLVPSLPLAQQADILEPLIRPLDVCLVDMTGLGLGLYELLLGRELPVVGTVIGTWHEAKVRRRVPSPSIVYVGKAALVGRAVSAVNSREITVAPWCCHRQELRGELEALALGRTPRGRISINAHKGHDDLAIALGLAIVAHDLSGQLLPELAAAA